MSVLVNGFRWSSMTQERVGKCVRVFWSDEEEWFPGTIQEYDESKGYYVVYDDGDERWESSDIPLLVEGEEEAQTNENYEILTRDRSPEMMEPPASPGSNYEDEYDERDQDESQQNANDKVEEVPDNPQEYEPMEGEVDRDYQEKEVKQEDDQMERREYEDNNEELGVESDDEVSVAESEMPQTFAKNSPTTTINRSSSSLLSTLPVPIKGLLKGKVLRATGLQTSRALAPNAFVRVSFIKSGDATHANAMLRCKETLSTTEVVRGSVNPVWSDDPLSENNNNQRSRISGEFQLELLPRIVPPATKPAWDQLPGDVLFTVFSASKSDSSRTGANEHLGQATVSLHSLLQDLRTISPFTTRVLELRSRSGRRLGYGNTSTRSLFEDGRAEVPTLIASFRFIPTFESKTKPKVHRSLSRATSIAPAKTSSRSSTRQDKASSSKRIAPARTSSSSINRRRFEKQIAEDNRSFAKRLEWKEARRTRQSVQAKAQDKKKVTPPQYGARKHDHKASSGINRTKYVHQVAAENKAIGKRLQYILNSDEGARNPEKFSNWAAEPKDSTNVDYMDRDKVHAQDKRWQRQVELDFIMEQAKTKYKQQNEIVTEVMELQETVRRLKTRAETLNKSVVRLEILNKKDQHVRDCLLRAASATSIVKVSPRQPISVSKRSLKTSNDDQTGDNSGKHRKKEEWELLAQHRDHLQADKQKLSHELKTINKQEVDLESEINDQHTKWEVTIATQLFHRQMDKKNAIQAQKEMKRRQNALELSHEEEELWKCYQAHQELIQLQISIQILRDQQGDQPRRLAATRASSSASTAVCDYLSKKIDKQKTKLQQLQADVEQRRSEYEMMIVSGGNEKVRKRVQELQKLVFLCQAQATHVKKAERLAQRKGEKVNMEFQRRMFNEQTETDIVLKKPQKQ